MTSVMKINDREIHGFWGSFLALVLVVFTFFWIAIAFLLVVAIILSPFILVGLLIVWLV